MEKTAQYREVSAKTKYPHREEGHFTPTFDGSRRALEGFLEVPLSQNLREGRKQS